MGLLSSFDNITGWTLLQKNTAVIEAAYAANGTDKSDIAYFKSVAPTLTTPDKLLGNYRALSFVTTAYGLGSEVNQTAILRKLLTQDPTASTSLAQQLADNNYRVFATALSTWTPPPFSSQATINATIAGYQQHSFEASIGTDNSALQEAEYFTNTISGVTKLSQIMSDPALLDVVRTALGIPTSFGGLTYDQQVEILAPRVDLKQFQTTDGVSKFVTRYLAMDELNQSTTATGSDPILSLFGGSSSSASGAAINLLGSNTGSASAHGLTLSAGMLNLLA